MLWERMCFFCAFLWHRFIAVLWSYRPAKMNDVKKERICIKFCFKFRKRASETHRMLKEVFGDNALDQTQTYEWFKRFKNGRMSFDDEERSGRHSTGTTTENVAKVDNDYIAYKEYFPQGRTRNGKFFCEIRGEWCQNIQRNFQTSGATPGPNIMTTLRLTRHSFCSCFWLLRIRQPSPNPTTHRITPSAIFFYSRSWYWRSRGDVLIVLNRSRSYRRMWWRRWHEVTSKSASDHGNSTRIAVSMPQGTTSKGMGRTEISVSGKATAEEFRGTFG